MRVNRTSPRQLVAVCVLIVAFAAALAGRADLLPAAEPARLTGEVHIVRKRLQPLRVAAEPVYHVRRATKTPVLDAKLDEWRDVAPLVLDNKQQVRGGLWDGPNDLSGSLKMMWDEKSLYFAIEAKDNVVNTPKPADSAWENDSCQIIFDTLLDGYQAGLDHQDLSYCAARLPTGPVLAHYRMRGRAHENNGLLPDKTIAFAKLPGGYVYEWSIPWERLTPVAPWILGRCGFGFTFNDNDDAGFRGALAWTEGAIYGLNPSKLGQIVFDGALGLHDSVIELPAEARSHAEHVDVTSHWLEVDGVKSLQTARLVLYSTRSVTVSAGVKVFGQGKHEPLATGRIEHALRPGQTAALTWDLSGLPQGMYEVAYEQSLVATTAPPLRMPFQQYEHPAYPAVSPPWVPGYLVRYLLRIEGDPASQSQHTVMAQVPTGGWLKPDSADLVLRTLGGQEIPVMVLSADNGGDTLIQFQRHENDLWYWLYAANPDAPPLDKALLQRIAKLKESSKQAGLAKMALAKTSALRAGELRDITAQVTREQTTLSSSITELAQWDKLLPERVAAAKTALAGIAPKEQAAAAAEVAHAPPRKISDGKTAIATPLLRDAAQARSAAQAAVAAHDQLVKAEADARAALPKLRTDAQAAATRLQTATQESAASEQAARVAAEQATAAAAEAAKAPAAQRAAVQATATQKAQAAQQLRQAATAKAQARQQAQAAADQLTASIAANEQTATSSAQKIPGAKAAAVAAEKVAVDKEAPAKRAADEAQAARLAAAPTGAVKDNADAELAQVKASSAAANQAVVDANNRIVEVRKLKANAEKALAVLLPKSEPLKKVTEDARLAAEKAAAEAATLEKTYFDLAHASDPRVFKEGLTVEFRQWAGDKLNTWAGVVDGLQQSSNVLGNAIVTEVIQNANPFRRSDTRNFAASYRGYLKIDKPGIYSFLVNGDDASFLFIDGYKVYSRTGTNLPIRGSVPLYSVGADIQLEAGVHAFEVHHIVGNSPDAQGICSLLWLTPGSKQWAFVPPSALTSSMLATVATIEAQDGGQVATVGFGMDDTLSADGMNLYLVQVAAQGTVKQPNQLVWDFHDGTTGRGASLNHAYFASGDYEVKLKSHPRLPPFRRRCHIWMPPVPTSPHALGRAVKALGSLELSRLSTAQLNDAFQFLLICEQPSRWPVLERVCETLLQKQKLDLKYRTLLLATEMEALAQQGRGEQALQRAEQALKEAGQLQTLPALVLLKMGDVQKDVLRDFRAADKHYSQIIHENRRLRHPLVRQAAVSWGDMFVEGGDLARAADAYRLAHSLGAAAAGQSPSDPVKRGALLRVAEQQLREGNTRQTRRLLQRIEAEFPEQKLEGLYRFLRGEAQRTAGHYDLAIRDYEVLLQLRQWAGYRPNALFGIADSYYRMGDLTKAQEWLAELRQSFPAFWRQRQLDGYLSNLKWRLPTGAPDSSLGQPISNSLPSQFVELNVDFEPQHVQPPDMSPEWQVLPSFGLAGPYTARGSGPLALRAPRLERLPSQGTLWVEFWYRNLLGFSQFNNFRMQATCYQGGGEKLGEADLYPASTVGQWHKAAFSLPAPTTPAGSVTIQISGGLGVVEIDGLKIAHSSDQRNDALRTFIEGANPQ